MSYGGGYKRPRPDEIAPGYGEPVPYGPPGNFGPVMGPGPEGAIPSGSNMRLGTAADGLMPVVKLRGLPFSCDDQEIKMFLEVETVDIVLVKRAGRFSGEAFVVFPGNMQLEFALGKHKAYLGKRYVEVQRAYREDYYQAVAAAVTDGDFGSAGRRHFDDREFRDLGPGIPANGAGPPMGRGFFREGIHEGVMHPRGLPRSRGPPSMDSRGPRDRSLDADPNSQGGLSRGDTSSAILRLRGLPYSATRQEVAAWFNEAGSLSQPIDSDSVHLVLAYDGRPTGQAFVEFLNPGDAHNAMARDKAMMGNRYVELFHSSRDEVSIATGGAY